MARAGFGSLEELEKTAVVQGIKALQGRAA